jgi:hypothetical protein
MVGYQRVQAAAALALALGVAGSAHAHFTLLKPTSWLKEDSSGGPQKGSPCGPGNTTPFLGDDVQPIPASGEVTTFQAGDNVDVEWQETVYHPGYFRISLAETDAKDATETQFPKPPVDDPSSCSLNLDSVPTGAHDNVLADGLFKVDAASGSTRHLMQQVTLPNKPCDKCTLQVVQVMKDHGLNSCYYFHCADIKIVPAGTNTGGTSGSAGTGSAGASGASGSAGTGTGTAGSTASGGGTGGTKAVTGTTTGSSGTGSSGTTGSSVPGGGTPVTGTAGSTVVTTAGTGAPPGSSTGTSKKSGCNVVGGADARSELATFCALVLGVGSFQMRRRRSRP